MALYTARDSAVALSASTTKTIVQVVASSSKPVRIVEIGVSFDGTSGSATPVAVDLLRQTTAGTSSSLTFVYENPQTETAIATALKTFTAEPTAGDILRSWYVTPAGGLFVMQFPLGREPVVGVSGRIGIRCNAPATVNTTAYITFEE